MKYHVIISFLLLTAVFTGCDRPSAGRPASTFKEEVTRLTSHASNRTERIQALFAYVRDNVRQIPTSYG